MRRNTNLLASLPAELIKELSSIAFGVARRITGDRETALDIAQEVLIGSMDHWLNEPAELKAYIVRSAMNRAFNVKRDAASHRSLLAQNTEPIDQLTHSNQHDRIRTRSLIHSLLKKLATKQKEALTLRFFADMKIGEIADAMRISEGAVKTHLIRALANLRSRILNSEGVSR